MSFDLTEEQQAAVDGAVDYVKSGDYQKPYVVSGLAGVGKTVVLASAAAALRSAGANPCVCAPTGKAAYVINTKDPSLNAMTIHRALSKRPYDSLAKVWEEIHAIEAQPVTPESIKKLGELYRRVDAADRGQGNNLFFEPITPEEFEDNGYDCLVFDESSMIGRKEVFDKLIAHHPVPLLFFGDSGQLPPVNDTTAVNLTNPNVKLTKILRQGEDSGIIPFAYEISVRGNYLTSKRYADVELVGSDAALSVEKYLPDHQIVCWMNRTRWKIAPMVRKARGFIPQGEFPFVPQPGEVLLVDQNDYQRGLLRGEAIKVLDIEHKASDQRANERERNPYKAVITIDHNGVERKIPISLTDCAGDKQFFQTKDGKDDYWRAHATRGVLKVQYDGVITAHKAQGSEWDKVVYFGDMRKYHDDWKRHAYTGTTRARSKLVVISGDLKGR